MQMCAHTHTHSSLNLWEIYVKRNLKRNTAVFNPTNEKREDSTFFTLLSFPPCKGIS